MLRALLRFWWVAVVGIVLAGVVFVYATYTVELGMPPKLTARAKSTYTASTQLLITSKNEPYLSSTNVNAQTIPLGTTETTDTSGNTTVLKAKTYDSGSGADGDLQRLVEIANSLPPRVTSDTVIRLRNKTFRRIDGSVNAVNPYAFNGAGGFREGPLPFIKITGTANSPEDAIDITNQTAVAFQDWYTARQVANKIPAKSRVLVEQVNSAESATANSGSKPLLGVAAAFLVLLGIAGLALALDRLIPRRARAAKRTANAPAPSPAPLPVPLTASVAIPKEPAAAPAPEPELPPLEMPTMTFGAQVEESANGEGANGAKPAERPRKTGSKNGSTAPRRRRTTPAPRVAPTTDDAS
jgi:capsular polysaccharide biosynthesis protein